ncbi:TolC family protein [uncultured Prevotella sp.]|uniref:TolC family protein n=1 Tax=uncultured Prevotella sp. TaxID=159272 RepID=UPI0025874AD4|nr:TolC family protein [uncultured Prevotella sp.]
MKKQYIIFSLFLFLPILVSAQSRQMTLQEVLAMAAERSLTLQRSRMEVDKTRILQGTAFHLDATSVSLSQDPTSGGSPDNAITVSQSFALPSVYSARRSLLKSETSAAQSRLAVSENELRREVSLAFYDLLYAQDVLHIYARQDSIYKNFNRVAEAKLGSGETGRLEQMNAIRLKQENDIKSDIAQRDFLTAQLQLMKWLNTDTLVIPLATATNELIFADYSIADVPLLALAKSQEEVANRQLKLEKRNGLPTFSVGASVQTVIKGFNPYNIDRSAYGGGNFMGFSVGVNIPLAFGAQKAQVKAARKEVEMAQLNVRNQEYVLRKTYDAAYNNYVSAHKAYNYYQKIGVPQAREVERISKVSYEYGQIGYVELMQNLQSALEVWKDFADATRQYNKAIVELNYLQGK